MLIFGIHRSLWCYAEPQRIWTWPEETSVRGLVYTFIAAISIAIAGTAYFGLTFTIIEAFLAGLVGLGFALFFLERTLRQRAHERLERSIQDLSRLLSTDAKAGQNLSHRLNELADLEPGRRLDVLEADVSVLGTVVRELAESVAELEKSRSQISDQAKGSGPDHIIVEEPQIVEPTISREELRQALAENRLIHHMQPIITIPQRRTHGYDLVPRMIIEDEELAEAAEFMPVSGSADLVGQIEALALMDAITIARRSKTSGEPVIIYTPISAATLSDKQSRNQMLAILDSNRAISDLINFLMTETQWLDIQPREKKSIKSILDNGVGFSLSRINSLRLNFAELSDLGVKSVRANAKTFIDKPSDYTDFHTADIAAYVNRFGVDLIMDTVTTEQQVLTLLDDGIGLAQGDYLAAPGPIRSDLLFQNEDSERSELVGL